MKIVKLLVCSLVFTACGDNLKGPSGGDDGGGGGGFPPAPALGAQIDRFGRPAINTALNAALDPNPLKDQKKDAYNQAASPAAWATTEVTPGVTVTQEFLKYIAIFDMLDAAASPASTGCGNNAIPYADLATVLVDDQMYVDSAKGQCGVYLSLEAEAASGGLVVHQHCGGRTLTDDIADVSYSFLFGGLMNGFTPQGNMFIPKFGDGADAHTDVSNDAFPFLGPPH